jgi:hypothetical protein
MTYQCEFNVIGARIDQLTTFTGERVEHGRHLQQLSPVLM